MREWGTERQRDKGKGGIGKIRGEGEKEEEGEGHWTNNIYPILNLTDKKLPSFSHAKTFAKLKHTPSASE